MHAISSHQRTARPSLPSSLSLVALLTLAATLWAGPAEATCRRIDPPWHDYPMLFDFGSEIVLEANTPVGSPIATATLSSGQLYGVNGGWVAKCDEATDAIKYWWLEQHYSQSSWGHPVSGVDVDSVDGNVYVMQDSGSGNPYGGSGSGSVGYTTELLVGGNVLPFTWLNTSPNKNLAAIGQEIRGIPCSDAINGTGAAEGYPPVEPSSCPIGKYMINWRQLPSFQLKVTLYRLGGSRAPMVSSSETTITPPSACFR